MRVGDKVVYKLNHSLGWPTEVGILISIEEYAENESPWGVVEWEDGIQDEIYLDALIKYDEDTD